MTISLFNRKEIKQLKKQLEDKERELDSLEAEFQKYREKKELTEGNIIESNGKEIKQLKKQLEDKERELDSLKTEFQKYREKKELTEKDVIESSQSILDEMIHDADSEIARKKKECIEEATQLIANAKLKAKEIIDESLQQASSSKTECEKIINEANAEAYKIRKEEENLVWANFHEHMSMVENERKKAEIIRTESEILFQEVKNHCDRIIKQLYRDKEELLNGLSDHTLMTLSDKHKFLPDKMENFITNAEDISFKNDIGMSERQSKWMEETGEAIRFSYPYKLKDIKFVDVNPITKLCLAHFDLLTQSIIKSSPKYGIEKSIAKVFAIRKRIENSFSQFNISISSKYIDYKITHLRAYYAYEEYKNRIKEELAHEREMKREEEKAQREYERAIRQAEKDEEKARRMIEDAQNRLQRESLNEQKYNELQQQIDKLNVALQEAVQRAERAKSMAEQTRRGYVYIISNLGSFGENVFKIGLTRRLDPTERIDELSNASVPFPFDIHAIIESEDAPNLESTLHKHFDRYKLNKTNWRKEFFKVPLSEIERVINESGIQATFIKEFSAIQYRESLIVDGNVNVQ